MRESGEKVEILTSVNWYLATTMASFWWVVCVAMATLVAYKNSSQIVCLMFCNYRTAGNFEGENFREFQGFVPIHKKFSQRNWGHGILWRHQQAIQESFLC